MIEDSQSEDPHPPRFRSAPSPASREGGGFRSATRESWKAGPKGRLNASADAGPAASIGFGFDPAVPPGARPEPSSASARAGPAAAARTVSPRSLPIAP